MTRDSYDETVDEAISVLIEDETEAFALVALQEDDLHAVQALKPGQEELLAVWMLVEQVRSRLDHTDRPLRPVDVLAGAAEAAARAGYLDDAAQRRSWSPADVEAP